MDDLDFKFYTNSATKGCNVLVSAAKSLNKFFLNHLIILSFLVCRDTQPRVSTLHYWTLEQIIATFITLLTVRDLRLILIIVNSQETRFAHSTRLLIVINTELI